VITDNMAGLDEFGRSTSAGSARTAAADGAFANTIGTYTLAVMAERHRFPFTSRRRFRPST